MTTAAADTTGTRTAIGPTARNWLVAAAAIGPLCLAADQLVLPYSVTADGREAVAGAIAHPGAMGAALWLDLLTTVTLLAGVLAVCFLAMRTAPRLGTAAAVASAIGFGALPVTGITFDLVAQSATAPGADSATVAGILDTALAQPAATVGLVAFLAGQLVALALLGIAVRRTAPTWAWAALIASGPLHVVFPGLVPGVLAGALTWVVTAVALAATVATAGRDRRGRAGAEPVSEPRPAR